MGVHDLLETVLVSLHGLLVLELILMLHLVCLLLGLLLEEVEVDVQIIDGTAQSLDFFLTGHCLVLQLRLHIAFEAKFTDEFFPLLAGIQFSLLV